MLRKLKNAKNIVLTPDFLNPESESRYRFYLSLEVLWIKSDETFEVLHGGSNCLSN